MAKLTRGEKSRRGKAKNAGAQDEVAAPADSLGASLEWRTRGVQVRGRRFGLNEIRFNFRERGA